MNYFICLTTFKQEFHSRRIGNAKFRLCKSKNSYDICGSIRAKKTSREYTCVSSVAFHIQFSVFDRQEKYFHGFDYISFNVRVIAAPYLDTF